MKTTSLKIDEEVWKIARKRAIELGMPVGQYLAQLIHKDMEVK